MDNDPNQAMKKRDGSTSVKWAEPPKPYTDPDIFRAELRGRHIKRAMRFVLPASVGLLAALTQGCASAGLDFPCGKDAAGATLVCHASRRVLFTNIGTLVGDAKLPDGSTAHIEESGVDQTTAAANALAAAAQLALKAAAP